MSGRDSWGRQNDKWLWVLAGFLPVWAGVVLHICITKVTFCVRLTVFELDAVPQMSSWRPAGDTHTHTHTHMHTHTHTHDFRIDAVCCWFTIHNNYATLYFHSLCLWYSSPPQRSSDSMPSPWGLSTPRTPASPWCWSPPSWSPSCSPQSAPASAWCPPTNVMN